MRFALLFFALTLPLLSQSKWQLALNRDGVKVYERKIAGTSLIEVKARTTLNFAIQDLLAVILDYKRFKEWQPYLKRFERLITHSDYQFINYFEMNLPWPVNNRDLVTKTNITVDQKGKWVHIFMREVSHKSRPRRPGIVRIPLNRGKWSFKPVSGGKRVYVEFTFRTDPGGSIPHWLVNWVAKYRIASGFKNLKARMKKVKGDYGNEVVKAIKGW